MRRENKGIRVTDKHVFFWNSFLSNWAKAHFVLEKGGEKMEFFNSEQYFMWKKAKFFKDEETAKEILAKGANPKVAKELGRKVKNYDDAAWAKVRKAVMFVGVFLKFSQNEDLKDKLLSKEYEGKGFVEGSPVDRIWGIGVHWSEASDDETTWNGQNLLGKVLDDVREKLANP